MKNKKAASQITSLILSLFVLALILVLIFGSPIPFIKNGFKSLTSISTNPCQCGQPENGPEQIENEGINYCIYAHRSCEGLNLDSMYKTIQYTRIVGGDPVPKCVYVPSDCEPKEKQGKISGFNPLN